MEGQRRFTAYDAGQFNFNFCKKSENKMGKEIGMATDGLSLIEQWDENLNFRKLSKRKWQRLEDIYMHFNQTFRTVQIEKSLTEHRILKIENRIRGVLGV